MNCSYELSTTPNPYLFGNVTSSSSLTGYYLFYVYASVFFTNTVLGLPINCYVLWLIFTGKGRGVVSEIFSLNLTFCEMAFCLGGLFYVFSFTLPNLLPLALYAGGLIMFGRPLFLCLICVERYSAVLFPVTFLKFKPLRYRLACCAVVWLAVLGFSGLCISVISTTGMHRLMRVILTMFSLILFIKLFCCLAIVRALRNPEPGQKGKEKQTANHMKRRAITVILILTAATVFQFSPTLLVGLLFGTISQVYFDILWSINCTFSLFIGYVHSFLYIHRVGHLPFFSHR